MNVPHSDVIDRAPRLPRITGLPAVGIFQGHSALGIKCTGTDHQILYVGRGGDRLKAATIATTGRCRKGHSFTELLGLTYRKEPRQNNGHKNKIHEHLSLIMQTFDVLYEEGENYTFFFGNFEKISKKEILF